MSDPRIIAVNLDERTILWRNADVEQERRIAIFDLLESNYFKPLRQGPDGYAGPFRVTLRVEEGRLAIDIGHEDETPFDTVVLALSPFRLGEQPNIRVGVAMITSAPEALALHERMAKDLWRRALKGPAAVRFMRDAMAKQE